MSAQFKERMATYEIGHDKFHLFINPVAIGNGMTIFKGLDSIQNLIHTTAQIFECGIALLRYELKK